MILVDSLKKWEILIKQLFCAMIFSVETPEQHAADSTGGEMKNIVHCKEMTKRGVRGIRIRSKIREEYASSDLRRPSRLRICFQMCDIRCFQ